jgi:hypothetical protein
MTGDPSSELQQYLQLDGQPRVGIIMIWNGVFIPTITFYTFIGLRILRANE